MLFLTHCRDLMGGQMMMHSLVGLGGLCQCLQYEKVLDQLDVDGHVVWI